METFSAGTHFSAGTRFTPGTVSLLINSIIFIFLITWCRHRFHYRVWFQYSSPFTWEYFQCRYLFHTRHWFHYCCLIKSNHFYFSDYMSSGTRLTTGSGYSFTQFILIKLLQIQKKQIYFKYATILIIDEWI